MNFNSLKYLFVSCVIFSMASCFGPSANKMSLGKAAVKTDKTSSTNQNQNNSFQSGVILGALSASEFESGKTFTVEVTGYTNSTSQSVEQIGLELRDSVSGEVVWQQQVYGDRKTFEVNYGNSGEYVLQASATVNGKRIKSEVKSIRYLSKIDSMPVLGCSMGVSSQSVVMGNSIDISYSTEGHLQEGITISDITVEDASGTIIFESRSVDLMENKGRKATILVEKKGTYIAAAKLQVGDQSETCKIDFAVVDKDEPVKSCKITFNREQVMVGEELAVTNTFQGPAEITPSSLYTYIKGHPEGAEADKKIGENYKYAEDKKSVTIFLKPSKAGTYEFQGKFSIGKDIQVEECLGSITVGDKSTPEMPPKDEDKKPIDLACRILLNKENIAVGTSFDATIETYGNSISVHKTFELFNNKNSIGKKDNTPETSVSETMTFSEAGINTITGKISVGTQEFVCNKVVDVKVDYSKEEPIAETTFKSSVYPVANNTFPKGNIPGKFEFTNCNPNKLSALLEIKTSVKKDARSKIAEHSVSLYEHTARNRVFLKKFPTDEDKMSLTYSFPEGEYEIEINVITEAPQIGGGTDIQNIKDTVMANGARMLKVGVPERCIQ